MNKNKQFLKEIGRKNPPSMDEISGDEFLCNTYLKVFYSFDEAVSVSPVEPIEIMPWL